MSTLGLSCVMWQRGKPLKDVVQVLNQLTLNWGDYPGLTSPDEPLKEVTEILLLVWKKQTGIARRRLCDRELCAWRGRGVSECLSLRPTRRLILPATSELERGP